MKFIQQSLEEFYLKKQFNLIDPLSRFIYFLYYFKHQFMYPIKAHQKQKSQNQNFNGINLQYHCFYYEDFHDNLKQVIHSHVNLNAHLQNVIDKSNDSFQNIL